MARQGFYIDQASCSGCRTCQVACKDKNHLKVGELIREVTTFEVGSYPSSRLYSYPASCNHCESPACVEVCPNGATYINEEDGTVQHDDSKCIGCQYCVNACPYGHPQYIEELNVVHKCDGCYPLRLNGEQPACVAACPMRAIEFGPIEELRSAHPDAVDRITVLPDPSQTKPSLVISAKAAALEADPRPVVL